MKQIRLVQLGRRVALLMLAVAAVGSIVTMTQEQVESRRRWRDRTAIQRMTGESWGRYRRSLLRSQNVSYNGNDRVVARSRVVGEVRASRLAETQRVASSPRRQRSLSSGAQQFASAQRVSYRWRQRVGEGEMQDLSALGKLSGAEIAHLSSFGPQRKETFNQHLRKRWPSAEESTPDGGSIQWFEIADKTRVAVNGYEGEGNDRKFVSRPGDYRVGLKFDAAGNYQSLGVGEVK